MNAWYIPHHVHSNGRGWSMKNRNFVQVLLATIALTAPFAAARAQRCVACTAEDTVPHTHLVPGFGVRVGAPQKASVALGAVYGADWQRNGRDHSRNVGLFVEPGLSGGRASVAYLDHGYGSFGSGFGVAASMLRTWNDPWWARENQTYVGGEVILWPIVFVGPRLGIFRSIGGNASGDRKRWLVTFDFGFGL
jgi:hypothetical protein